jgi:M6 family metalloprotease-like protein
MAFAHFQDEVEAGAAVPGFAADIFAAEKPGSLTHFYGEMSRGQFQLSGQALPRWYAARHAAQAYVEPQGSFGNFVREVLEEMDRDVDLGLYDNDGPDGQPNSGDDDGYVDFLFVVTLSAPKGFIAESATGVAALGLGGEYLSNDRAQRGGFIRVRGDDHPQGAGGTVQQGHTLEVAVGSMAHEFGHFLGLPDLYDLSFDTQEDLGPADDSGGIGYWGVMGHGNRGWGEEGGPNPFCAWSLGQLGWLGVENEQLVVVRQDLEEAVFEDVNAGGRVYLLPEPDGLGFFLVEYRARGHSYYERNLPAEGLLIWRVNPLRVNNNDEQAKLVDLVCADGLYLDAGFPQGQQAAPFTGGDNLDFWAHNQEYRQARAGNLGDGTDVWDGERFADFWAASNPAAPPSISVTRIRRQGERRLADLRLKDHRRAGPIAQEQVWGDSVDLVGDVVVLPGGRLSIREGTQVRVGRDFLGAGQDSERVELRVLGELLVNFSGREEVLFTSAFSPPRPGDWQGIVLDALGSAFLRRTRLEHARVALAGKGLRRALTLEEVVVRNSLEDGLRLEEVEESVELRQVRVEEAGGMGARVTGRGLTRVGLTELKENSAGGLERQGGFLELVESRLSDNGLETAGGANLVLGPGVFGRVVENSFNGGVGIHCVETREVLIADNVLNNHRVGLVSTSARPRVSSNQFNRNELALEILGFAVPSRLDLNVVQATEHLVDNRTSSQLVATNNWWGRADEGWIEARIHGLVQWRPFLNFDPRVPLDFALKQNYPNPFNGSTLIEYQVGINDPIVEGRTQVTVEVRTLTGALVRRLVEELAAPGFYSVVWDGRNAQGERVASGAYYYQLQVGPIVQRRKLLFLK